jgi:D-sedoheptulose 7-phosphate isomerase
MNKDIRKQIIDAIETHKQMIAEMEQSSIDTIAKISEMITESLKHGGGVYICGNGGSAADAQHIAGELVGRFRRERKALRAIALSTDTSVMTSVGNDYGFESIFSRQVEALVRKGDILWAISTSGSSANVMAAAKLAKKIGARIIAFTGKAKSELENISDICLCAENNLTARSQEIHELAYHIICDLVEQNFANEK